MQLLYQGKSQTSKTYIENFMIKFIVESKAQQCPQEYLNTDTGEIVLTDQCKSETTPLISAALLCLGAM